MASESSSPTLVSLVGDMERRRDVAETLAQRQLELEKLMLIQVRDSQHLQQVFLFIVVRLHSFVACMARQQAQKPREAWRRLCPPSSHA